MVDALVCAVHDSTTGWHCAAVVPARYVPLGGMTCEEHIWLDPPEVYMLLLRADSDAEAERERVSQAEAERRAAKRAYEAMWDIQTYPSATVYSRVGMLRLVRTIFGDKDARVRWSWPPEAVARAHRAKGWP